MERIKDDPSIEENLQKIEIINKHKHGLDIFIETGTAGAVTSSLASQFFKKVYTIDLNFDFYLAAIEKTFSLGNVFPLWGDSPKVLNSILFGVDGPCVILLDAHDVGDGVRGTEEAPVLQELEIIFPSYKEKWYRHVILIDDARLFGSNPNYPSLQDLQAVADRIGYAVKVENDIIVMVPECLN